MPFHSTTAVADLPDWTPGRAKKTADRAMGMPNAVGKIPAEAAVEAEIDRLLTAIRARVDRCFAWLMLAQWAAAIAIALWVSPLTWAGDASFPHPHATIALFYGGLLTLAAVALTWIAPGERVTRLTIAVAQALMSSLLIHLTGGRIETHFHLFVSLAFLAFYLDWQVLVAASLTIALDHFLRGMFLPFSIFGTHVHQPWRWLEHTGWVVLCDVFLLIGCNDRLRILRALAVRHLEREELLHHALFDSLTGLPNRSFLSEKMSQAMQEFKRAGSESANEGFCCLYIDLDRFKEVNDEMGHVWGDALLRRVAERIQSKLGEDVFLARGVGDKFIALAPRMAIQPRHAEEIARAILRGLLQPFDLDGKEVTLGASIGISRFPQDGQDETELLLKSDRAMYNVKRGGRNGYRMFSAEMEAESNERDQAERDLHRAIEENEFRVHYQPIFHAHGEVAGLEALLRWSDPQRGNISPAQFIPLAEETGLIVQLGSFVLHEACRQATDWHSRGLLAGRISVNVSSLELAREDYARVAILTLRQHYTPPECIEIEVTETALVSDFAQAERNLKELRAHGIRISIDDFGTGYSSFGRLRQLTLDTLKIDRLFVEGVASSEADRTVVEHIIAMAHTLGMKVVAEGVETESQLAALRSLNCDQIQGYLLGKPMDMATAEALLVRHSMQSSESIVS